MTRKGPKVWRLPARCLWGRRPRALSPWPHCRGIPSQLRWYSSAQGDGGVCCFSWKLATCPQEQVRFPPQVEHRSAMRWWACDPSQCWYPWQQRGRGRRLRQPLQLKPCFIPGRGLGLDGRKLCRIRSQEDLLDCACAKGEICISSFESNTWAISTKIKASDFVWTTFTINPQEEQSGVAN